MAKAIPPILPEERRTETKRASRDDTPALNVAVHQPDAVIELPHTSDSTPRPKVVAAGLAGAATTIILYIARVAAGLEVPAEVGAAIATIMAFLFGYITSEQ